MIANGHYKVDKNAKIKYIAFLICPLFAFIYSIKSISTKGSRNIFILFGALFGFTLFVPAAKGGINLSVDSTYYRMWFENIYSKLNFPGYLDRVYSWITFDINYQNGEIIKDIYLDTIGYISSFFGDTYHIMFMFATIIFTIIACKCLRFLTSLSNFHFGYYSICILLIFTFNQFCNIHWFRFPTAAWVAVYAIFQMYANGNKKYILLLPLCCAIHGSFMFFLIMMIVVMSTTKRFERLWVFAFFVSIFISSIPQSALEGLFSFLPERLRSYAGYSSVEGISERAELISQRRTGSLIDMFGVAINIYMNILMYLIIRKVRYVKTSTKITNVYPILLGLFTIINAFSFIKEFSERFRCVTFPLLAYVWLSLFSVRDKERKVIYLLPVVFAYQLALNGYIYYMTSGLSLLISPFISIPYYLFTGEML